MAINCVANHFLRIMDRGGKRRITDLGELTAIKWDRRRDDISEASVVIQGSACSRQAKALDMIEPGRHEFAIYRGDERVWEGPITRTAYTPSTVSIYASDVLWYASRTTMRGAYSSAFPNVETSTARAARVLTAELARQEAFDPAINVLPYLTAHHFSNEAMCSRVTLAYASNVWQEVDYMAHYNGIDYTTVGRAIHLIDTSRPLGQTPQVSAADFLGEPTVTAYGNNLATIYDVSDGQGNHGSAGATDPYYGNIEFLDLAYGSTGDDPNDPAPTSAVMASQARRDLSGRHPTPVQVHIPDNSSVNPNGVLALGDLVPGVFVPLLATLSARTLSQMQKIDSVVVAESIDGETIQVTMNPAPSPDAPSSP